MRSVLCYYTKREVVFQGERQVEKKDTFKRKFGLELIFILILIIVGIVMIGDTMKTFGDKYVINEDEKLYHLAEVVDLNINGMFSQYYSTLDYVTQRNGFLEAENLWKKTEDVEELAFRLEENLLAQDENVITMLAIKDNEIFLSTNGEYEYYEVEGIGTEKLRYYENSEGTIYIAFVKKAPDALEYAALMEAESFYHRAVGDELSKYDWIILMDKYYQVAMYHPLENLQIEILDSADEMVSDKEGINILADYQKRQEKGAFTYKYIDDMFNEERISRIAVTPTNMTDNEYFAIGVVISLQDTIGLISSLGGQIIGYGIMVVTGILLLVANVFQFKRRGDRNLRELEILREKNALMEEVNRKTQEVAHHQRLETIGTLTAGVAHEFNNLLTPIMGYSMMTLEQLPSEMEDLYDNVLEIYQASVKAKDITSRLSELSRKNSPTAFKNVSMKEISNKVRVVGKAIVPPRVVIMVENSNAPCVVKGNETQLSQMVLNLITNAFHAMEKDGGTLKISIYEEGEKVIFKVKDTGCGIPEDIKDKIFEPFFTTKETGKGTGLGLAIVQQIVSEHQGSIRVESEVNVGSTFTVELDKAECI